jgi:hypothetical protein
MKKVSAVEWLLEQLENQVSDDGKQTMSIRISGYLREQAKEMEKEQHSETWNDSRIQYKGDNYLGKEKSFEEYYNETFKN